VTTLRGHEGCVTSCRFGNNSEQILTTSKDKTCKLWDLRTNGESLTIYKHKSALSFGEFKKNQFSEIGIGSYDCTTKIVDIRGGKELMEVKTGHTGWIFCCEWSPCHQFFLTGAGNPDYGVKITKIDSENTENSEKLSKVACLPGNTDHAPRCNWSPDGKFVVCGSDGNLLKIWDVQDLN